MENDSAITVTRLYDGSIECAVIFKGYRVHMRYFGYSKNESLAAFKEYLKEQN